MLHPTHIHTHTHTYIYIHIYTEISKKCTIHSCRSCQRWLAPPWQSMNLESKELMTVCLRKVTGLSKVKLIDAVWIWTEPHSLRLKIKLTVQCEVVNNAVLQQAAGRCHMQAAVVEFVSQ
jgi:nonsense-mediated mRNA decay protein 3